MFHQRVQQPGLMFFRSFPSPIYDAPGRPDSSPSEIFFSRPKNFATSFVPFCTSSILPFGRLETIRLLVRIRWTSHPQAFSCLRAPFRPLLWVVLVPYRLLPLYFLFPSIFLARLFYPPWRYSRLSGAVDTPLSLSLCTIKFFFVLDESSFVLPPIFIPKQIATIGDFFLFGFASCSRLKQRVFNCIGRFCPPFSPPRSLSPPHCHLPSLISCEIPLFCRYGNRLFMVAPPCLRFPIYRWPV